MSNNYTKAQTKALDDHRHIEVEHTGVFQDIIDHHIARLDNELGFFVDIEDVQWTGFYSQGDGLSFTGSVHDKDKLFAEAPGFYENYPSVYYWRESITFHISRISGRAAHSGAVIGNLDASDVHWVMEERMDGVPAALFALSKYHAEKLESQLDAIEEDFGDMMREQMDLIYREMEEEYDYLTSDEQVEESLRANDLWPEEEE